MSVKEEEEDHERSPGSESSRPLSNSSDDEKGANRALSDDVDEDEKTKRILAACETRDIGELQELAMSKGGFLSDANRALACESIRLSPLLCCCLVRLIHLVSPMP